MADKTPAEKMHFKPGMSVAALHVPPELEPSLGIPAEAIVAREPAPADFILEFATTQAEAEQRLQVLAPLITQETIGWLCYPKGSKAAGLDISRDTVWEFARTVGLALVANVSVDETWSAVRFKEA